MSIAPPESVRAWTAFAFQTWSGRESAPPHVPIDRESIQRLSLAPLVHHACGVAAVHDDWSDAAAQYRHAATANLIRLAHGARLRDALEAHGIPAVLLKGGAFLVRFCDGAPGVRAMADLDVLIDAADAEEAERVMVRAGFDPAHHTRRSDSAAHARSFVSSRGPMPIEIDLHRAVAPWPIATGLTARIMRAHDRVAGWRIPRLPDAFCLAALHRARHGFVWSAIDLFEMKAVAAQLGDDSWREVMACASANRLRGALWAAYRQAVWWLGADDEDEARLAGLERSLGPVRRHLLARMAAPENVLAPDCRWQRPLPRNFIVAPCATTTFARAIAAAALFLPVRMAEEWASTKQRGLSSTARVRWLLEYAWRGIEAGNAGRRLAPRAEGTEQCTIR